MRSDWEMLLGEEHVDSPVALVVIYGVLEVRPLFIWPWSAQIDVKGRFDVDAVRCRPARGHCRSGQGVRSEPSGMVDSMVSRETS